MASDRNMSDAIEAGTRAAKAFQEVCVGLAGAVSTAFTAQEAARGIENLSEAGRARIVEMVEDAQRATSCPVEEFRQSDEGRR